MRQVCLVNQWQWSTKNSKGKVEGHWHSCYYSAELTMRIMIRVHIVKRESTGVVCRPLTRLPYYWIAKNDQPSELHGIIMTTRLEWSNIGSLSSASFALFNNFRPTTFLSLERPLCSTLIAVRRIGPLYFWLPLSPSSSAIITGDNNSAAAVKWAPI